jgi:type III pantothenate kinase
MTPDVVVDIGNTRIKFGWCIADEITRTASLPSDDQGAWGVQLATWGLSRRLRWAVASVHPERLNQFREWAAARGDEVVAIDDWRQLPVRVEVDEPGKVGIDRLLNAVAFRPLLPKGTPGVIIDVGTAITVDLLDERHTFVGGAILPGPRLMFESLHRQTAKLPLIDLHQVPNDDPPGRNTRDAMAAGVMAAVMGGADFLVREYASLCSNPPWVMMTGGALGALADYHFDHGGNTQTDPTLTLDGIRIAAEGLP